MLFSSVQSLSRIQLFATPWTAARQASLSITNSWSLLKLMSIESVMPSNHHTLCRPFLLPPSIFPSIRVFSKESVLHIRWPKNWSFSFNINPSNKYSGLISFRMDWLDLLAVQRTLKSLLPFAIILCLFWVFGHKSCGIVADWPGVESAFPALEGEVLLDLQGSPSTGVYKAIGRVEGLRTREIAAGWGYWQYNHGSGLQNPEGGWGGGLCGEATLTEAVAGLEEHNSSIRSEGREHQTLGNKCSSITSLPSPSISCQYLLVAEPN